MLGAPGEATLTHAGSYLEHAQRRFQIVGRVGRTSRGRPIPRQVYLYPFGWTAIRPLAYGDFLALYENGDPGAARYAALFRRTIHDFESTTAADVNQMYPEAPVLLEYAALAGSGYVDSNVVGTNANRMGEEQEPQPKAPGLEPGEDIPDDSIWAAHNTSPSSQAKQTAKQANLADLKYLLTQNGESHATLYQMLMPEIDDLLAASKRAENRAEERADAKQSRSQSSTPGGTGKRVAQGNRRDRASQVFGQ